LISLYAVLAGLFSGWRTLVRNRRTFPVDRTASLPQDHQGRLADELWREPSSGIELSWQAAPSPAFRVDPLVFGSLTLHGAATLALGGMEFWLTLVVLGQKENWFLRARDAFAMFLMLSLLILTWDFIGHMLAQPLLGLLKVPANYAVGPRGLYYGAFLQTWSQFSHFSRDLTHHEVHLHPARCPGLVTYSLNPPDREGYERLVKLMPGYLPAEPPPEDTLGTTNRWTFFILLMLTVFPFLLVGLWLAAVPNVPNALYFGLSSFAATRLGGKVIRRYT
jgi:hypothetical protein